VQQDIHLLQSQALYSAVVRIVGDYSAALFARKFQPLDQEFTSGVFGYEALAMFVYTTPMNWHEEINTQLWSGFPEDHFVIYARTLNSALTKLPVHSGTAYKGYTPKDFEGFVRRYQAGRRIEMLAFTSATRKPESAFSGDVLFTIRSRTGAIIWMWSADYREDEVVFRTNTTFGVLSLERFGNRAFVALEEV